jgi:hypothetical protein
MLRRLEELTELVQDRNEGLTDEARGWLARLLVVRSSGYVEQVVAEICRAYVDAKSSGLVRSFSRSWLERSNNPTPDNLLVLVGRFDAILQRDLDDFISGDDERLRRELSFLVDRRNKIAHGLNEGIGPARALALKGVAVEIADWFILRMNPSP